MDRVVLHDINAAVAFVERHIVDSEGRPVYRMADNSGLGGLSEMSPIQLLVVASHFHDARCAHVIGSYDNGPSDNGLWTVGDKLFHLFQEEFYADNRQAMLNPPPYLSSVESAARWMHKHSYNLASMKQEFMSYVRE